MSYPFSINSVLVRSDGHSFTFRKLLAFCRPKHMSVLHSKVFFQSAKAKMSFDYVPPLPNKVSI